MCLDDGRVVSNFVAQVIYTFLISFSFFFLPLPSNLSLAREINSMEDLLMEKSKWNSWGKIQIVDIDFPCAVGSKEGAVDCLRGWKADEEFPIRF